MNKIMTVQFKGAEIFGFQMGGVVFVALKPIVEGMGLNWEPQRQRVQRDPVLSKGASMIKVPLGRGGPQEMICLPLELIHGWLFTIDSSRSAADLWEKRGLPKVASMDDVFRQPDLFERATLVPRHVAA